MGVLNVTPDSFSDGGRYLESDAAVAHGLELARQGADIIDVGGESTRPGAGPVPAEVERHRVLPVIRRLRGQVGDVQLSIDTSKLAVAEPAIAAGASFVNDVTAFRADPDLTGLVADRGVECCLMHMQGTPATMQTEPRYRDVVDDVKAFLEERLSFAVREGVGEEQVLLDPGIGFGKTVEHNLELLARLGELLTIGRPLVVGTSRKSFLGKITGGRGELDRLPGTIATSVLALERGARVFRVHDVAPVRDALLVAATVTSRWRSTTLPTPSVPPGLTIPGTPAGAGPVPARPMAPAPGSGIPATPGRASRATREGPTSRRSTAAPRATGRGTDAAD
jgi:dihydropteroate synthase